jgi:hypothetical protein
MTDFQVRSSLVGARPPWQQAERRPRDAKLPVKLTERRDVTGIAFHSDEGGYSMFGRNQSRQKASAMAVLRDPIRDLLQV